jgi:hypothetical protein
MTLDRRSLDQIADGLALAFYLLIAGSLFAVITGGPGLALFLLVLAAVAHVGRAGIEDFVAAHGEAAQLQLEELGAALSRLRRRPEQRRTPAARRRR